MRRRTLVSLISVVGALAIGAYAVHVGNARAPEASPTNGTPEVNRPNSSDVTAARVDLPSRSDPPGNPEAMPHRDVSSQQVGDPEADSPSAPLFPESDSVNEVEASIERLLHGAVRERSGGAGHDLLRFILEEDIRELSPDADATESFEQAILTVAATRGIAPDGGSGVSDLVCTVSLCTFVAEPRGTFSSIRQTPEWHAMELEGPVPSIRAILGPAHSWVRFGVKSRDGETQVRYYYYRPGIERHRELLEAVAASRDEQ